LLKVALITINQSINQRNWQKDEENKTKAPHNKSRARTHAVLVIGLYELLGNPTT
jgi:hypothetical protein